MAILSLWVCIKRVFFFLLTQNFSPFKLIKSRDHDISSFFLCFSFISLVLLFKRFENLFLFKTIPFSWVSSRFSPDNHRVKLSFVFDCFIHLVPYLSWIKSKVHVVLVYGKLLRVYAIKKSCASKLNLEFIFERLDLRVSSKAISSKRMFLTLGDSVRPAMMTSFWKLWRMLLFGSSFMSFRVSAMNPFVRI